MLDTLAKTFDFSGRLSFAGRARLERKLLLIAVLSIAGPIVLFMVGAPPLVGVAAAMLFVPVLIGSVAANVRRLHDVGRHAHRVYLKRLVWLAIVAAPVAVAVYRPDLPAQVRWGLTGTSGLGALIGLFIRDLTWTEWLRGEPGPNSFGPAPE